MSSREPHWLDQLLAESRKRYELMTDEERAAMWEEQCRSFVRGMTTPCEHGVLDFESCQKCRIPSPLEHERDTTMNKELAHILTQLIGESLSLVGAGDRTFVLISWGESGQDVIHTCEPEQMLTALKQVTKLVEDGQASVPMT